MRLKRIIVAATAVAAATGLAACGGGTSASGSSSSAAAPPAATSSAAPSSAASGAAAGTDFGSGCASVPASGAGSFNGMATDPVATAASHNPLLSTLVALVGKANLGNTLNSTQGITVFAPDNPAFAKVPAATVTALEADPTNKLAPLLEYHVVPQKITPAQLANGSFTTLTKQKLTTSGSGESFTVNGSQANIVCGNVQTANATVYIIDSVLTPPSS